jgi:hypothetical protein
MRVVKGAAVGSNFLKQRLWPVLLFSQLLCCEEKGEMNHNCVVKCDSKGRSCACAYTPGRQAGRLARKLTRTRTRTAPHKQDTRATYTVGHEDHLDVGGGLIAVVHVLNSVWQRLGPRILPQAFEDPVGALGVIGNLPAHTMQCA